MSNGTLVGQEFVEINLLHVHPRNLEVYGDPRADADFAAFVEYVRKNGIHPLIIADDMTIIGGHRRYYAAQALGIPLVHATLYHFESETDKLAALIADNQTRQKDNQQKMNEAVALMEIESERALQRQVRKPASDATNGVVPMAPSELKEKGEAREKVAAQLGVGASTVSDMVTVKEAVAALEAKGRLEQAAGLISLMNHSVERAAKEARKVKRADLPVRVNKDWIGLAEWETLSAEERASTLSLLEGDGKFNRQTGDSIEWAQWSWNPISGCLHNCPYCYARDIAQDKYVSLPVDERFSPTFYPNRLVMPSRTKVPDLMAIDDPIRRIGLRNVFTCSMADLFGKWVPVEWIEAVLGQIAANPQWTFLLLTKFPIRMAEFDYPPNTWIGTTVDRQYAVERAEKAFTKIRAGGYQGVAWLSCEPMMERLTFSSLEMFDWVVMGGASRSSETPAFAPPQRWISHLVAQADACNLPIYQKTNLIQQNGVDVDFDGRIREYPV